MQQSDYLNQHTGRLSLSLSFLVGGRRVMAQATCVEGR